MSQTPVVCPKQPLTRDLDVEVFISRPQTELATDMTMICVLTPNVEFSDGGNDRVRFYNSMEQLTADVPPNSAAYWAGNAFFARSERPSSMAVGQVFTAPTSAVLRGGQVTLSTLKAITDGAFDIIVSDMEVNVTGLNFSTANALSDVAAVVEAKLSGVTVTAEGTGLMLKTTATGDGVALSYAEAPATGTDVSSLLALSEATASANTIGYTPGDLTSEAALVATAARCAGHPVYGWILDGKYRDTQDQKSFADWIEARDPAIFIACTNSPQAYNTADTSNIGYYAYNKGYKRTGVIYHNNAQVYPDMSYLACALSVNYALQDSTITLKFKQLDGIEPSPLTNSEVANLESRNINCYVYIGNTAREVREGTQALDTWFTDSLVNLDNFKEELQVAVYNVFLRNKKVPYTMSGQNKLVSAAASICRRYTSNGTFANRDIESLNNETGFETLPATDIRPAPITGATASDRAKRLAPPIQITAYEAGAFHKVTLNVSVYN